MTEPRADISIAPLGPEHYDEALRVWEAAGLPAKLTGRESRSAFVAQLDCFPTTYLGAWADGRLVGLVMGTHDQRKGWINRLAVDPKWQRRGVGQRLVAACEAALAEGGIEIIAALIEHGNEPSRRLFEACGYVADVPVHYYRKRFRADI